MAIYEDNLFLNSIDKKSEFYVVATPGAMLVYGRPQDAYLYLDASMDFTTLQETDDNALAGETLTLAGKWGNAKSQVSASHQYRDVRDVDVQVGTRLKRRSNSTSADYEYRVSSKTSLGLVARHVLNQFSDSSYADYRDYSLSGRLSWQALPKTSLYGRGGHGWVDVDERADAKGDAQYNELAVGVMGRPGARLETSGEVGVQHRYFSNSDTDDITREVGSIRVAGEPVERLRTWLAASASMQPAINAPGYTVLDTRIEPGISRRLFSERIVGSLSGLWGQNEYSGSSEGVSDPRVYDGRKDEYWGFNVNIDCWIGRYWSAGAGYSYMQNDSAADETLTQGQGTDASSYEAGRWMLRVAFNR
jgi:opacity protein-like surface antigen